MEDDRKVLLEDFDECCAWFMWEAMPKRVAMNAEICRPAANVRFELHAPAFFGRDADDFKCAVHGFFFRPNAQVKRRGEAASA